jgi:hypothetical protein
MHWLVELFVSPSSVAHAILVLSLIGALGRTFCCTSRNSRIPATFCLRFLSY